MSYWPYVFAVIAAILGLLTAAVYKGYFPLRSISPGKKEQAALVIHSAVYGTGPDTDIDVAARLQSMVRDGLVVPVSNDLVSKDPNIGAKKHLTVEYSYGNPHRCTVTRTEGSRLVLPEDTWMRDQITKRQDHSELADDDPRIYVEIRDNRQPGTILPASQPKIVLLLVNRGKSEAKGIYVDALVLGKYRVEFDNLPSVIAPEHGETASPMLGMDVDVLLRRDLTQPFIGEWNERNDLKIEEITVPLRVTYCDFNDSVIETKCELVFHPFEHTLILTRGVNGRSSLSTRNFRFRRLSTAL